MCNRFNINMYDRKQVQDKNICDKEACDEMLNEINNCFFLNITFKL